VAQDTQAQGPSEQELRELAIRGEALRNQLSALEAQREYVLELSGEARRSLSALEHLASAQEGDDVLIPLGGGAFVHGRLASAHVALSSLGSGVHAEVPMADARDRMKARAESLDNAAQTLTRDVSRVADEMARINAVLEQFYGA
jgi:prefoldin alpha subunit